jgi:hypothetical protein
VSGGASTVSQVATFLDAIASWESSHSGYKFQVFAYVSGSLVSSNPEFVDVSNSTVRSNIAEESAKFTSHSVSGSYIAGASRTFDGVLIDFEPAGGTSAEGFLDAICAFPWERTDRIYQAICVGRIEPKSE